MRSDVAPGGTFPDYEQPDHTRVPGLRDAWEACDVAPFHEWDKRGAATPSAA